MDEGIIIVTIIVIIISVLVGLAWLLVFGKSEKIIKYRSYAFGIGFFVMVIFALFYYDAFFIYGIIPWGFVVVPLGIILGIFWIMKQWSKRKI